MDLFDHHRDELARKNAPLADRMRPRTLDEFAGQEHIIGPGRLLRRAIQIDQLSSVIFYGPPGTGKTTLARIIANTTRAQFLSINAVLAGVKDIREAIDTARKTLSLYSRRTILFVDEVHRFNKAQQDALLPHVENGTLILIGATTENPYFEVNKALVSRSRIFQLRTLTNDDLKQVALMALNDSQRGYGDREVSIEDDALDHLVQVANGDARGVLNALELAVETTEPDSEGRIHITRQVAEESIQRRAVLYDKDGDAHYDTISAFIKSMRGSDPDAALYWMAKMVYAGEDPRFIFRRMLIFAGEDIGLADPRALQIVVSASQAFDYVGMPEGRFHLAQACLYLATAPKSNTTMAFFDALDTVAKEAKDDVPNHLRDPSRDGEGMGHGQGYLYPHAYRDHWVAQQYLPSALQGRMFYEPTGQGYERGIREQVTRRREAQIEALAEGSGEEPLGSGSAAGATAWQKRTGGSSGTMLSAIRDRVLEYAGLRRDSLVLDLHARTGLLTFEAARRCVDGTIWTVAHDTRSRETLATMAQRFPQLQRPQIVQCPLGTLEQHLHEAAGGTVRFDAIVGRNALAAEPDKKDLLRTICGQLRPGGKLVLAETVFAEGQRLSALLPGLTAPLAEALIRAEEALFSDPDDPRMNWRPEDLEAILRDECGLEVRLRRERYEGSRRISGEDIEHWFRAAGKQEQPSLGDRLRVVLDGGDIDSLRQRMLAALGRREVSWGTVVGYVVGTSPL